MALVGALAPLAIVHAAQSESANGLSSLLARVGASVERYYARAQSLVCLETVRIQSLRPDLMPETSFGRQLTYELRVAWDKAADGQKAPATVQRELVKVGNRAPRPKDKPECLDPSAVSPDTLAMLLPSQQAEYTFTLAGRTQFKGRNALQLDYRSRLTGPATATEHEGREDCWKIDMPGRTRGRIWIDADTSDVLRLDEHLIGFVDLTLPENRKRARLPLAVVFERLDSSIVFGPIAFVDPDETLTLPVSADSMQVVRNAGVPRVRKTQKFSNYRRFITGGRVVEND